MSFVHGLEKTHHPWCVFSKPCVPTIRLIVTYGVEPWALTENNMNELMTFERRVLRKIFGPCQERDGWGIRSNHELNSMDNIVGFIKTRRLQ